MPFLSGSSWSCPWMLGCPRRATVTPGGLNSALQSHPTRGFIKIPSDFTGITSQKKLMLQNDPRHFMHVSLRNTKFFQLKKTWQASLGSCEKRSYKFKHFRSANKNHSALFDSTILVFKQACETPVTDLNSAVPGAVQSQNNPVPASRSSWDVNAQAV